MSWTCRLSEPPFRKPSLTGSKGRGLAYERRVGRELLRRNYPVESSAWFRYKDALGTAHCEVDHLLVLPKVVVLVECKLTQSDQGVLQLLQLYAPVASHYYGLPLVLVLACKHLSPLAGRTAPVPHEVEDFDDVVDSPSRGVYLWHYLG